MRPRRACSPRGGWRAPSRDASSISPPARGGYAGRCRCFEGKAGEMEGKQKVALTFALYQNDALVRRETVTQDIVKVGKDAKSHLRVDDELASRMHAVIEVASPEDITLIDLGNEPGTMVNGARVNKCKITPGDQLQIGGTRIVLEHAEAVAVAAAAAPRSQPAPNPFA